MSSEKNADLHSALNYGVDSADPSPSPFSKKTKSPPENPLVTPDHRSSSSKRSRHAPQQLVPQRHSSEAVDQVPIALQASVEQEEEEEEEEEFDEEEELGMIQAGTRAEAVRS